MTEYRVTAPYVNLKIKDRVTGKHVIRGFYDQAIVAGEVEQVCLARHLDRGWLEEVTEPVAAPAPVTPPPPDPDKVPDGTADEVTAWVGDSSERAALALAAEQASAKPRKTLMDQLSKLVGQA